MVIEEIVKTVLTQLRETVKTETVVGNPIITKEATIVPVSRVSIGFGIGGGKFNNKGQGGEATGVGMTIEPVAFIVVWKEKVELILVRKEEPGIGRIIELIPEIAEKIKGMTSKKDSKSAKAKTE